MRTGEQRFPRLEDLPEHCTIKELKPLFPVHPSTLYRMVERGELPHLRFGGKIVIPKRELIQWMEGEKQRVRHASQ